MDLHSLEENSKEETTNKTWTYFMETNNQGCVPLSL